MNKPNDRFNTPTETPISRTKSPAGDEYKQPVESSWPKSNNSGLYDREKEFEFPIREK